VTERIYIFDCHLRTVSTYSHYVLRVHTPARSFCQVLFLLLCICVHIRICCIQDNKAGSRLSHSDTSARSTSSRISRPPLSISLAGAYPQSAPSPRALRRQRPCFSMPSPVAPRVADASTRSRVRAKCIYNGPRGIFVLHVCVCVCVQTDRVCASRVEMETFTLCVLVCISMLGYLDEK